MIKLHIRKISFLIIKIKERFFVFLINVLAGRLTNGIDLPFTKKNRLFLLLKFVKKAVKYLPFQSREFFRWKKPR